MYQIDPDDLNLLRGTTADLIGAVMGTMSKSFTFAVPSRRIEESEGLRDLDDVHVINLDLPIKACLDLLLDGIELNHLRYERLRDRLRLIASQMTTDQKKQNEVLAELCNRLNLGATELSGSKLLSAIRTDYIGWEVDRFFRISKCCKPGVLTVGDTLLSRLDCDIQPADPDHPDMCVKTLVEKVPHALQGGGWSARSHQMISESVAAEKLKGVGLPYELHHIFGLTTVGLSYRHGDHSDRNPFEATHKFLNIAGYFGLPASKRIP